MARIGIYLALALLAGCASAPEFDRTRTFEAPVEQVWEATRHALHDEFLEVESSDREAMVMVTDVEQLLSGLRSIDAICKRPFVIVALWSRARHQLSLSFHPHDDGTDVTIDAKIEAYEMNNTRRWHECASKGRIESDLFRAIEKRLRAP